MKATRKELFYNTFSDKWENSINKIETRKRIKVVFGKLLKGIELKGKEFLEIGCGLGHFAEKAYEKGAKVTAIDIGEKLVEKTKERVPGGKILVASAAELPFEDEFFDIVLSTEVIEHVEDQKSAFSEMLRVLKRGGYLVLTTPNKMFKSVFDFLSFIKFRPYHGNEKWLSSREIKKFIKKMGAEIIKETHFNFIYPNELLDRLENIYFLSFLTINQGYLLKKK